MRDDAVLPHAGVGRLVSESGERRAVSIDKPLFRYYYLTYCIPAVLTKTPHADDDDNGMTRRRGNITSTLSCSSVRSLSPGRRQSLKPHRPSLSTLKCARVRVCVSPLVRHSDSVVGLWTTTPFSIDTGGGKRLRTGYEKRHRWVFFIFTYPFRTRFSAR